MSFVCAESGEISANFLKTKKRNELWGSMPRNADAFDLLAMSTLADEAAIKRDAGPGRKFSRWANMNEELYDELARWFRQNQGESPDSQGMGGIYSNNQGMDAIRSIGRYQGTNLNAFFQHTTVEFRSLSSPIVSDPQLLVRWIQYYLMLPQIASSRKQIRMKTSDGDTMVLTRQPGGTFRVDMDGRRVRQPAESPDDLRASGGSGANRWDQRIERLMMSRFGKKPIKEMPQLHAVFATQRALANHIDRLNERDSINWYMMPLEKVWETMDDRLKSLAMDGMATLKIIPRRPFQ